MKSKTIRAVLRKKINEWIDSIEDPEIQELARANTIVTGGAIASMLLKEPVNDFDIYFRTFEAARRITEYYVQRFESKSAKGIPCKIFVQVDDGRIRTVVKSAGVASAEGAETPYAYFEGRPADDAGQYVGEVMSDAGDIEDAYVETEELSLTNADAGKPPYRPVFVSTNAITLSGRIQIINRFYGEPDAIHENYDYVHCTNYWKSWDGKLVLRQAALESLLSRELRYVGSKYPVCSVIRLRKFIKRGWVINAGQILKMMVQITDLDLHDPMILQDQLTGVDSAYFCQLMTALKEKDPAKVETAYLVEIIDRMF